MTTYLLNLSIFFMPMIDLNSTDPEGLLSTMYFITDQSVKYNMDPVLAYF